MRRDRILPQSKVTRAILLECSPCCGRSRTPFDSSHSMFATSASLLHDADAINRRHTLSTFRPSVAPVDAAGKEGEAKRMMGQGRYSMGLVQHRLGECSQFLPHHCFWHWNGEGNGFSKTVVGLALVQQNSGGVGTGCTLPTDFRTANVSPAATASRSPLAVPAGAALSPPLPPPAVGKRRSSAPPNPNANVGGTREPHAGAVDRSHRWRAVGRGARGWARATE